MLCPLPQLSLITERPPPPNSPEAMFHGEPHSRTVPEFSKADNQIFCSVETTFCQEIVNCLKSSCGTMSKKDFYDLFS